MPFQFVPLAPCGLSENLHPRKHKRCYGPRFGETNIVRRTGHKKQRTGSVVLHSANVVHVNVSSRESFIVHLRMQLITPMAAVQKRQKTRRDEKTRPSDAARSVYPPNRPPSSLIPQFLRSCTARNIDHLLIAIPAWPHVPQPPRPPPSSDPSSPDFPQSLWLCLLPAKFLLGLVQLSHKPARAPGPLPGSLTRLCPRGVSCRPSV